MVVDLHHLADQAAIGDHRVARLGALHHRLMGLHPLLLRTDKQEIEDDEDEKERGDLQEEARGAGRGAAARLCMSLGYEHREAFWKKAGRRERARHKARCDYHGDGPLPRQGEWQFGNSGRSRQ